MNLFGKPDAKQPEAPTGPTGAPKRPEVDINVFAGLGAKPADGEAKSSKDKAPVAEAKPPSAPASKSIFAPAATTPAATEKKEDSKVAPAPGKSIFGQPKQPTAALSKPAGTGLFGQAAGQSAGTAAPTGASASKPGAFGAPATTNPMAGGAKPGGLFGVLPA